MTPVNSRSRQSRFLGGLVMFVIEGLVVAGVVAVAFIISSVLLTIL